MCNAGRHVAGQRQGKSALGADLDVVEQINMTDWMSVPTALTEEEIVVLLRVARPLYWP